MHIKGILNKTDHTFLKTDATKQQIKNTIDDAVNFGTASVCIPPSFVKEAKSFIGDKIKICTVIGFPNGYNTTQTKIFEAKDAVNNGADELDMVINIGWVKDGLFDKIKEEINAIKAAVPNTVLKVIIETCLLTKVEIATLCRIINETNAEYIKTSTGFSFAGANKEDILLIKQNIDKSKKIKAAGGIKSLKDAEEFILLGCSRLGASSIVAAAKENKTD